MFGRYVTINCLYVKDSIVVWVPCEPDTPIQKLKNWAREMIKREMERQLKGE
ncbi:hypothetical protein [Tissierella pigra]|uniref:hypothetical protein n=1 Tax=Tissierella pigra TaxID=2607614 RepID=UPI0012B3B114|nr:hypothetical protein [Tissierella pigra]